MNARYVLLTVGTCLSLSPVGLAGGSANAERPIAAVAGQAVVLDQATIESANGTVWEVTKLEIDGKVERQFRRDGVTLNEEAWRAWDKQNPPAKIDPEVRKAAGAMKPGAMLPVVITLREGAFEAAAADVQTKYAQELAALEARREMLLAMDAAPSFVDDAARAAWLQAIGVKADGLGRMSPAAIQDPLRAARLAIAADRDELTVRMKHEAGSRAAELHKPGQDALEATVRGLGGAVRARLNLMNGVSAFVPAGAIGQLENDPSVGQVTLNMPGQRELQDQATSLGLTTGFWANGIDGGANDGGQLDSGCQQNHPTFAGITFLNGPGMGVNDTDDHGTAVASIMVGGDASRRGMAFGTTTHLNTSWNDVVASIDWMHLTASDDPEVINGSFGIPATAPSVADYTTTERYIDRIIRTQVSLYTKSAGNLGSGANTLSQPAGIFNGLVVANVYDQDDVPRTNDVITASSSRGPTLGGRKKPDIAAPGTNTEAANWQWAAAADWINFGGTSSAAPHVAGGVLLLADARGSDQPLPIKAILINTADAWTDGGTLVSTADDGEVAGSLWNATYGWGYLDLGAAYTNRLNAISSTIGESTSKWYRGNLPANGKLTLVWNRFVTSIAGVETAQPLTDLDLRLYRQSNNGLIDFSTSNIDNVEQVSSSVADAMVVRVNSGVIDPDIGATESFALAHTGGFVEVSPPTLTTIATPTTVSPGAPFTLNIIVSNNSAFVPAHNVSVTITGVPAGWTVTPGSRSIGTLQESGQSESAIFTVTPPCNLAGTSGTISWSAQHSSYGQTATIFDNQLITVTPITSLALNTPTAVTTPRTFSFAVTNFDWYAVAGSEVASRNIDVQGDNDACQTSPWQDSTFVFVPDFILVNGTALGAGTQYAHIYESSGVATATTIEYEDGLDVGLASLNSLSFTANEPIEVMERSLNVGKLYLVRARVNSGFIDASLFLYRPTDTFEERSTAFRSSSTGGSAPGSLERFNYRPLETGNHAFVVTNENQQAGTVGFEVRCAADFDSNALVQVPDIFSFLAAWFDASVDADFNISGGAPTVPDIFDFLGAWFEGPC